MKKVLIGLVAIVVIGVAAFLIFGGSDENDNSSNNSSPTTQTQTQTTEVPASVTITYGSSGFTPSTVTVKTGGTVTVKNDSSTAVQFQSDPHPTHTDDPELNLGTVEAGKSKTFTVTTTGSHGYHNHLNPAETGTLIVQ